jgi:hypothetical protein
VLHLAAHQLQRSAPIQRSLSCLRNTVLPKARQVLMLLPAAHQPQVTLPADLHTPADQSTAQDKASARAAPRSTSTLKQSAHPERCHHASAFHAAEHRVAQGKAKQVPRPAAHQPQVTLAADLHTPADQSTAQDKASARAAPRSTSTSKPSTHPVRCQPLQLVVPAEHRLQATLTADV